MPRSVLLLRLEGPLQSWGTRARWDVRDTSPEPTKSGVIGLLGCALGYGMYDPRLEQLDTKLLFGVRVEHPGQVMVDYQTVTDFLPTAQGSFRHSGVKTASDLEKLRANPDAVPATIQSPRAYLEDAAFLCSIEQCDGGRDILDTCAVAICDPQWPLFLGRKACIPTRPVFETVTDKYLGIEDALRRHPWSWLGAAARARPLRNRPRELEGFVEVRGAVAGPSVAIRQDSIRTNAARVYGFRSAERILVNFSGLANGGEA